MEGADNPPIIEPEQTGEGKQSQPIKSTEASSTTDSDKGAAAASIGINSQPGKEQRRSNRVMSKTKETDLKNTIEVTSQSHQVYQHEIPTATFNRLQVICNELTNMSKNVNTLYDELNKSLTKPNSLILHDVDAINADNLKLRQYAEDRMSRLSVKPKTGVSEPRQSLNAIISSEVTAIPKQLVVHDECEEILSVRSSQSSNSSRRSTSSSLRQKAREAQAEEEGKRAKLAALQEQQRQEEDLAELQFQHQQELQRRKSEIERTKLQGEIAADQRRREVLEQAATEEEGPTLHRPPIQHPSTEEEITTYQPRPTPRTGPRPAIRKRSPPYYQPEDTGTPDEPYTGPVHMVAQPTVQQISSIMIPRDNSVHSSSTQSDHLALANALMEVMKESKLPPPEPFTFTGDLLQFADWKTSFYELVDRRRGGPAEKLALLKSYLSNEIKESISGYCTMGTLSAYQDALASLEEQYGDPYLIGGAFTSKLDRWPKVKANDGPALRSFVGFLKQCVASMSKIHTLEDLNTLKEMKKIIHKLPTHLEQKWIRECTKFQDSYGQFPKLSNLCDFLKMEVKVANNPLNQPFQHQADQVNQNRQAANKQQKHAYNTTTTSTTTLKPTRCMFCEIEGHQTGHCRRLAKENEREIMSFIKNKMLCFYCVKGGHSFKECHSRNYLECGICKGKHMTVLHDKVTKSSGYSQTDKRKTENGDNRPKAAPIHANSNEPRQETKEEVLPQGEDKTQHSYSICTAEPSMSMMIMPVYVSHGGTEHLTYALIDNMSDASFISTDLVAKMNIPQSARSTPKVTTLNTLNHTSTTKTQEVTGLKVRGYGNTCTYLVKLPTMLTAEKRMAINRKHIPTTDAVSKWTHLQGVAKNLPPLLNVDVELLIGANCNAAHTPLEVVASTPEEPHAKRTVLGWSVTGDHGNASPQTVNHNYKIASRTVQDDISTRNQVEFLLQPELPPSDQILKILESDFTPTKNSEQKGQSIDDMKFLTKLEKETYQDKHTRFITMPLPFKQRPTGMGAITRKMAEHRFHLLQKRIGRDPAYAKLYHNFMEAVMKNGDAEEVCEEENESWYIPHFGVHNPKKPNKIRVVFDCSAKAGGKCLNDFLLQGPDLMNSMLGILMRFRSGPIALSCDIERMFHQFQVTPTDRDYLRFLWTNADGNITAYRMKVHIFGAKSSPACATYGLRHLAGIASDNQLALDFITHNFYVDDGIISVNTIEEAQQLVTQTTEACQKGNLRLHKFVSNSADLLKKIPKSEHATQPEIKLLKTEAEMHRTLGIQWNTLEDTFEYRLDLRTKELTRRSILSVLSSVFDPLGLLAPVIIKGKLMLQKCCREKLDWDDELPPDLCSQWLNWTQSLSTVEILSFPRCYKPQDFGKPTKVELHCFSDASTDGYGACIYIRLVNNQQRVTTSLVLAKSRVAPSDTTTIPRLELQAAVLSATLCDFVKQQLHNLNVDRTYFYTDSQVVMGYINNDARRFLIYVSNRVQKIRNLTDPKDWHFVPTKQNPADHASRGLTVEQLADSLWINGPTFLTSEPLKLPEQPQYLTLQELAIKTNEVKAEAKTCLKTACATDIDIIGRLDNFSRWNRIVNLITVLEQFKRKRGKAAIIDQVSARHKAGHTVLRLLQQKHFPKEMADLQSSKTVNRKSTISKLNPQLDPDGLLRVGGRLGNSKYLEYEEKHPIILPKRAHITTLIIRHFHHKSAHQGRRSTLGQLRLNGFWIVGANSAVSTAIKDCVTCRELRGKLEEQQMASLPAKRSEESPPFTYVGCDIFGPFIVKERRSELKRYGAIFTCMASKAIHIELVDDMTTDGFINALRCVIAIRGHIRQLHTDRGTNFIGAANELHKLFHPKLGDSKITSFAAKNEIEFVTNVPYASHMGGIWERQIRSIRTVLSGLLKTHSNRLDTSSLRTLLYEVMTIINCRPLTTTDEGVPLHPNMLLTMKSQVIPPPPGAFEEADAYARKRWIKVQGIAGEFWERWRREYIQTLQTRQKWKTVNPGLKVNDVVLIKDDNKHRNEWKTARVSELLPSSDNLVRKVRLVNSSSNLSKRGHRLEATTELERPVHKLIRLYRPGE